MLSWLDVVIQQERYKGLMREVQKERLLRQAMKPKQPGHQFYCRALIWLGKQLVVWGLSLQTRFDSMAPASALELAHLPRWANSKTSGEQNEKRCQRLVSSPE